jgi:hypothetical protein
MKTFGHTIDPVEVSKRRVALHVLKTATKYELSNACIATAFGWTIDELLDFWREDDPKFVLRNRKR